MNYFIQTFGIRKNNILTKIHKISIIKYWKLSRWELVFDWRTQVRKSRSHVHRTRAFVKMSAARLDEIRVGYIIFWSECRLLACGGGRGGEGTKRGGRRRGPGRAPVASRAEAPAGGSGGRDPRLSQNELKMFHQQIVSWNKATRWTVCTLARIVAGISPATMCCRRFCPPLRSIPVWLNSPFPILTKQWS